MKPRRIGQGHLEISDSEKRYVNEALDTNRLSSGPFMERFEREFAERHDCKHAIMLNSGTSALQVSLAVLKEFGQWDDGDEVLVPASTFIATSNVVIHNNLRAVFVDIEPDTYNLDPKDIERHITEKTRAIIPAHLYGQPCDMDAIMALASRHGLKVIEDSCECMFARFGEQSVGSIGDLGCFSTYVAHIITTGVGGLITTNDDEYAIACRSSLAHGRDSIYLRIEDDDVQGDSERLEQVVARRFNFVRLGYSFRSTELEAALGVGQLERADEIIAARRRNGAALSRALEPFSQYLQLPVTAPNRDHSFMMYPVICKEEVSRSELVAHVEEAGIETRFMMPLLSQPIYQRLFGKQIEDGYPVAAWVTQNGFYLPCHHGMGEDDVDYIRDVISTFFHPDGAARGEPVGGVG